jgi:hypothetical protein
VSNGVERRRNKPADILVCQLPCDLINRTLGMEMEPGEVVLTRAHQKHAERNHRADYGRCLPFLEAIVSNPFYIGDDLKNDGIELISRLPTIGEFVLVAVKIERDENGRYLISSFYPVSDAKIQSRREKGFLRIAVRALPKAS